MKSKGQSYAYIRYGGHLLGAVFDDSILKLESAIVGVELTLVDENMRRWAFNCYAVT